MHITRTAARQQQKRIKSYRANCDSYSYFNLLTSNSLLDKVEELLPALSRLNEGWRVIVALSEPCAHPECFPHEALGAWC